MEIVNFCFSKFECNVTSDNWTNLRMKSLQLFDCVHWEVEDVDKPIHFWRLHAFDFKYSDYIYYIILKCFIRQSSFGNDLEHLQRLEKDQRSN